MRFSREPATRAARGRPSPTTPVVAAMVGAAAWLLPRAGRDYDELGRLSPEASAVGWALYLAHAALTLATAWRPFRSVPADGRPPTVLGGVVALSGLAFYWSGVREFRSFGQVSGTEKDDLVTSGPYRLSRNPQVAGWGLALLGAAVAGRSVGALASVAAFFFVHERYFDIEERHLERAFGWEYRRYREKAPRWLGLPKEG